MVARIKTDEEMARLEAIFAEVEAERSRPSSDESGKAEEARNQDRCNEHIANAVGMSPEAFVGNVRQLIREDVFRTKREKILALHFVKLYDKVIPERTRERNAIRAELEVFRNFATAVSLHLERAERSARGQDNHHYYKVFTETVKGLLEKL